MDSNYIKLFFLLISWYYMTFGRAEKINQLAENNKPFIGLESGHHLNWKERNVPEQKLLKSV